MKTYFLAVLIFGTYSIFGQVQETNFSADSTDSSKSKFRIGASGGLGIRTAEVAGTVTTVRNHIKKLRDGLNVKVAAEFITPIGCFGMVMNQISSSAYTENVFIEGQIVDITEGVKISFLGPKYSTILHLNKSIWNFGIGLGSLVYKDELKFENRKFLVEGKTIGAYFDSSVDIHLNEKVYLSISAAYTVGALDEITIDRRVVEFDDGYRESLSWIDFGVGFKFYF